jgi:hypothetical protein
MVFQGRVAANDFSRAFQGPVGSEIEAASRQLRMKNRVFSRR